MQASSIVALITPFTQEEELDFLALENLILWHIDEGTEGLVLCGSTGEGNLVTHEEKLAVFKKAVAVGKGKITLIATTGVSSTKESIALTKEAKEIGVDGCIAIVPYGVRPTPRGCIIHFSEIAKIGLPLIAYYHPGRTGTTLSLETLLEISQIPGVIGIKDSSGDLELIQKLHEHEVSLYCGDDPLYPHGFTKSISVIGNVVPKEWADYVRKGGEMPLALQELSKALLLEVNPQCVKFAVSELGRCQSYFRLPLLEPKIDAKRQVIKALQTAESALR